MRDIIVALGEYSEEWRTIAKEFFKCKCDKCGWCEEEFSCGRYAKKNDIEILKKIQMPDFIQNQKYNNMIEYKPMKVNDYPPGFKVTC